LAVAVVVAAAAWQWRSSGSGHLAIAPQQRWRQWWRGSCSLQVALAAQWWQWRQWWQRNLLLLFDLSFETKDDQNDLDDWSCNKEEELDDVKLSGDNDDVPFFCNHTFF
jgi:hypothetical protein